ncbi:MAG: PqqD family protein [Ruminococcaceae bacterium]|nr:PqqD family protein [Oscillospiraceae bacterium]
MSVKIKQGLVLREVAGSYVVLDIGNELSFNGMITLNESGKLIWDSVAEGLGASEIAKRITEEYDIDEESALGDVSSFIQKMKEADVFEEGGNA